MKLDDLRQLFREPEPEVRGSRDRKARPAFFGLDPGVGDTVATEVLRCEGCDIAVCFPMNKGIVIPRCPNCGERVDRSIEKTVRR